MQTPPDEIEDFLKDQKNEVKAFIKNIVDLVVYGSTSLTYNEAWNLSKIEREMFHDAIMEQRELQSGKKRQKQL